MFGLFFHRLSVFPFADVLIAPDGIGDRYTVHVHARQHDLPAPYAIDGDDGLFTIPDHFFRLRGEAFVHEQFVGQFREPLAAGSHLALFEVLVGLVLPLVPPGHPVLERAFARTDPKAVLPRLIRDFQEASWSPTRRTGSEG